MKNEDIDNRFNYHPATTEERIGQHARVRAGCWRLAFDLNALLPEGREKSLAITNLEEVMFWANAAVARVSDDD